MIRQAVVLVGGLGTRLGALTKETPKPLLAVGGKPFLHILVEELIRQDVEEILLLAGFQAEKLRSLASIYPQVRIVEEASPLGTGGALRNAQDRLDDRFFFLNGDSLFDINLWDLAVRGRGVVAALALRHVDDVSRYGTVVLEGDDITQFEGKARAPGPGLINGGVAVLSKAVVDHIASDRIVSIENEVYPILAAGGQLKGKAYSRPFIDIGVPDDFEISQDFVPKLVRRGAVFFDRDGVINADVNYAHRPDQIQWINGSIAAIKAVNDRGLFAFVVTNQAGVARGLYQEEDVRALHVWMQDQFKQQGAHIDCFEYSPFHPDGIVERYALQSACRKPGTGMIDRLVERFQVDLSRSCLIGDRDSDMGAAAAAGINGLLFSGGNLEHFLEKNLRTSL
jgi:D-glycero-D-manno-heptose 1,7-bisphosphate phosphatase